MTFPVEDLLKILFAVLIGGLIGAEREFRDKAAGFRTIIFICVGATLFTMFSLKLGGNEDPVRIAANIVSGVGFLGAGAILRDEGRIQGLTTASTIWLSAALGMGIGGGLFLVVSIASVAVLVVLWLFPRIEIWIDSVRDTRTYEIHCTIKDGALEHMEKLFLESKLDILECGRFKIPEGMVCSICATGKPSEHKDLIDRLFAHPDVKEFRV